MQTEKLSEKLIGDLLKLSRAQKLQAMQLLINDLSAEEISADEDEDQDQWSTLLAVFEATEMLSEYGAD